MKRESCHASNPNQTVVGFTRNDILSLLGWIGLVMVVMLLGGLATFSSVETWYQTLNKPSFNPPNWIFGPVWTALYLMMGIAAWLVGRCAKEGERVQVRSFTVMFLVQLALNLGWSFVFFGLRSPGWGLLEICLLWIAIAVTLVMAWRLQRVAAALLLPYLAWTSFATVLNAAIFRLN